MAVVLALGWAVMPLFFFGGDDTLDPTRLAMLPLRPRPLITALMTSSLVGVGPLFTLLVASGSAVAVAHGAAAAVVAVLAVALLLLTCVALSRAVAAANTRLLTSRKGRDLALLSGLFVAVGAQLLNLALSSLSSHHGLHRVTSVTSVLRWVPPASAVDAVRSASQGSYGVAAAQLALTALALALVLRWWHRSLVTLMMSPDSSTLQAAPDRVERKGGVALLGAGPAAAPAVRAQPGGHRPGAAVPLCDARPAAAGVVGDRARGRAAAAAGGGGAARLGLPVPVDGGSAGHADVQPVRPGRLGVLDGRGDAGHPAGGGAGTARPGADAGRGRRCRTSRSSPPPRRCCWAGPTRWPRSSGWPSPSWAR